MPQFSVYRGSPPYGTFVMNPPGTLRVARLGGSTLVIDFGTVAEAFVAGVAPSDTLEPTTTFAPAGVPGSAEVVIPYEAPTQELAWLLESYMPGMIARTA